MWFHLMSLEDQAILACETTFSKQICPNIFLMFSVLVSRMEHKKKLLKTEQQCTFVYIMDFTIFYQFFVISAALRSNF